jgi:mono/diheme cytochrome c family protein
MRGIMTIGRFILSSVLLLGSLGAGPAVDETELPPTYLPTGKQMYTQYCAACHGADGKGHGPLAPVLKTPPADLSTLAKRHQGKFPYDYVASVLEFGPGFAAHGSSDMPTWGPIFRYYDKRNERVVKQRIQNLSDYVASLQVNR